MNWGDSIWDSSLKSLGLNGGCSIIGTVGSLYHLLGLQLKI